MENCESVMKDEPEESRGVATHSKRLTQLVSCLAVWFYYCPKTPILQNIHQSATVQRTTGVDEKETNMSSLKLEQLRSHSL
jgi:hypothetical protein